MAFKWLNKQGVLSDAGFQVQVIDRFIVEYREGDRILTVEVEDGMSGGRPCLLVSPRFCERWDDMPSYSVLDDEEQQRIEKNFRDAFDFQGLPVVADYPGSKW